MSQLIQFKAIRLKYISVTLNSRVESKVPTIKTLDDYDSDQLGVLDEKGFNYEMGIYAELKPLQKELGFKITYHNPEKPHLWKRTKEHGIDFELEVKTRDNVTYHFYIEASYQSHDYYYRKSWFEKCRVPRFRNVKSNRFNIKVILTNRPHNMFGIRPLAKKHGIKHIVNLTALINLITRIRNLNFYHLLHSHYKDVNESNTKTNTNNVYAYANTKLTEGDKGFIEWLKWLHEPVRPIYFDYLRYKRDVLEAE